MSDGLLAIYADMLNQAIAGKPEGMVDVDASVPIRQFPLHLGGVGRL